MYQLNDTIAAVSSPSSDKRVIVRITGPDTIGILQRIFSPVVPSGKGGLIAGSVVVDSELRVDANLYLFLAPHSYTGETLAEIHIDTNSSVTEALMGNLLAGDLRLAGPGEFTARAYLGGKIDLAQAEAVNGIIVSSNKFQLAAAERILSGRLAEATEEIRSSIMDCLGHIEAGLDFSGEEIEFITVAAVVEKLGRIKQGLERLLADSISCETVIDLPAVGIAGATNAGKSRLLNKLLGKARSIVSEQRKTTRDVLTAVCTLAHCRCVLFDCAGLIPSPNNILDELAQAAAVESLGSASAVAFCVDISKTDFSEDIAIRKLIEPNILILVATKSDLLSEDILTERLVGLNKLFDADLLATSAKTSSGIKQLRDIIDGKIIETATGGVSFDAGYGMRDVAGGVALTARHKQAVAEAIEDIGQSITELKDSNDEVAAVMLRSACQEISHIEHENIDEQILERIFKHFCIGK